MIDYSWIKAFCLCAGWYCLYRAFVAWMLDWFYKKTRDGAKKVLDRLQQIRQQVDGCLDGSMLKDVVSNTERVIEFPIIVRCGGQDDPVEVDYQYSYNIDKTVKTMNTIAGQRDVDIVEHNFAQLKAQLIEELEEAIEEVEQRLN